MAITDFAIVTGLLEEFEALQKILPPLKEVSENAKVWYSPTLPRQMLKENTI